MIVLVLNLALVTGLVAVGVTAHSLAVLAEGGDYLLDAAGVGVALLAIGLSARPADPASIRSSRHQELSLHACNALSPGSGSGGRYGFPGWVGPVGTGLQFQAPVHITAVPDHSYGYQPGVVVHVVDDPVVTHPYSQPWPVAL